LHGGRETGQHHHRGEVLTISRRAAGRTSRARPELTFSGELNADALGLPLS
jgi:hypothetical protein